MPDNGSERQTISVVREIPELRTAVSAAKSAGREVALVPTMGALHAGHLSLIHQTRKVVGAEGLVVVTIFVNPTQFGPNEDLDAYPRELESDLAKCQEAGADLVFTPAVEAMYHPDQSVSVHESKLATGLCGQARPGHFDGVCTVVLKLFNLVQPGHAVFGEKDYQQLAVIRRMVRDLDVPVQIHGGPTVREDDGLAMSSRNAYLDSEQRIQAPAIRRGLLAVSDLVSSTETPVQVAQLRELFIEKLGEGAPDSEYDYVEVVDAESLEPLDVVDRPAVMACAVFFGSTRLIDNISLTPSPT